MDRKLDSEEQEMPVSIAESQETPTSSPKLVRGVFGYCGSKQRLANRIVANLPPHSCWVELFGGALALTMAKVPADIEIVNDIDDEITNAFRQIRDNGDQLVELIRLTPYSRTEFLDSREVSENDSELERARKFLVQTMMSVNGVLAGSRGGFSVSNTYAREGKEARVNRWQNYPERLKAVIERLRDVRIENKDGIELLEEFSNKPATLVYIDPPYLSNRRAGYIYEANDQKFHERLLSQALLCKCMIILSGYESKIYTKLLEGKGGWHRIELGSTTRATNGQTLMRTELLWMNKPAKQAWDNNCIAISQTKRERKDGRVNPPRGKKRKAVRIWRTS